MADKISGAIAVKIVDGTTGEYASLGGGSGGGGGSSTPVTLPATTDRSGSATTTSGGLSVPANANRQALLGQNVSSVNIGFNEQGGTAAIGSAGTYTVVPGASFSISSNKLINFVSATGNAAVTMTEY